MVGREAKVHISRRNKKKKGTNGVQCGIIRHQIRVKAVKKFGMGWERKCQDGCDYLAGGTRKVMGTKRMAGLQGRRKVCRGRHRPIIYVHAVQINFSKEVCNGAACAKLRGGSLMTPVDGDPSPGDNAY
jgi:hypothetical protein